MAENSKIEWTDSTWSPLRVVVRENAGEIARQKGYSSLIQIGEKMAGRIGQHCEHVSPECAHCYAEARNRRCLPADGTGLPYDRRSRDLVEGFVDEKTLIQPFQWRAPRRIFVENRSDIFAQWFSHDLLDRVFGVMAIAEQHTFQVLTKRAEEGFRYFDFMSRRELTEGHIADAWGRPGRFYPRRRELPLNNYRLMPWPLPNVWFGVTAGTKQMIETQVPWLRKIPAEIRFLSCEPLLEDLGKIDLTGIDWVIAGGESGPGARPMHPDWARSLRDQCQGAGVAFFHKQNGEHELKECAFCKDPQGVAGKECICGQDQFVRVGKKAAGRLLDGRTWDEFPEVGQ